MKITPILAIGLYIMICNNVAVKARTQMDSITKKQKVLSFYKLIVGQRKAELIPDFILDDYKQHNPIVAQGRSGITGMINYLKTLPPPPADAKSPIIRAIQEGDFVVTHLDIQFMGKRMAVIDLFKLKDGMLAEHWDAIQEMPDQAGQAVTSTNGTVEINETASEENSKRVVRQFYAAVIDRKPATGLIKADYVEHDPSVIASGKNLDGYLQQGADRNIKIHRVIAEGDFVVVQSQFNREGKTYVLYEIFRVQDQQIAEHWSVEQPVPDGVEAENMF
ncbi:nuclear transport factor 2 family protein [Mucilaginibacter dorajii]|uniref:SnoaL-like domain-containing protein n=1 Tax=Mucilaginibacter dorajii TaxID=692994 RepID=A0ABP7QKB2_9SPHI|nr:nuclear transport factor 2 family protein [Mucilaginibacter dorajii]MCS3734088.1 putative SnoaL-like aldol condensation-catalyzing enzyme [Mucilaginibacter dorajii]